MNVSQTPTGTASTDPPNAALLTALTTEHYTLQSARASTVAEANGRSLLFLSAVSGATVALALAAQLYRPGETVMVFALSVLPALLALGLTSYARLADLTVHDAYYARAIGRIRSYYFTIAPEATHYWLLPAGDDPHAVMRQSGQRYTRWHHLSHTATAVGAVTAVIAGVLAGLLVALSSSIPSAALAVSSTTVAVGMFTGFLFDHERRWRRSWRAEQTVFLPDGSQTSPASAVAAAASATGLSPLPA